MRIITYEEGKRQDEDIPTAQESLLELHRIAEDPLGHVHEGKVLTYDMDGPQIFDDNAIALTTIIAGHDAERVFADVAGLNIKAVSEGHTEYCWYAPTVFAGELLFGLPKAVNRVVGKHMRLIPDAQEYFGALRNLGYDVIAITAGHQEAAEEVSKKVGIEQTIGTIISAPDGTYNGEIQRFIGGKYKTEHVKPFLIEGKKLIGTHIGDSWSDIHTLAHIPQSVAFNPGCDDALQAAYISIVGTSKKGMIPLFDPQGKFDYWAAKGLPDMVIINKDHSIPPEDITTLMKESKAVKKERIGKIVDHEVTSYHHILQTICRELSGSGVNFMKDYRRPADYQGWLHDFDTRAKAQFDQYAGKR